MTQISEGFEEFPENTPAPGELGSKWPTEWHTINVITEVEARQTSFDTFQLRSKTHTITLNKEGFDLYRSGPDELFSKWLNENHIKIEPLDV